MVLREILVPFGGLVLDDVARVHVIWDALMHDTVWSVYEACYADNVCHTRPAPRFV